MGQEEMTMIEETKVEVAPYAKVKVYWDDRPENYSRTNRNKIRNDIARKYGVNKNNINVVFRPVKFNEKGEKIEITGAGIENIMDSGYQRQLFKEWFNREGKTVDFERLLKLDDKVNNSLEIDIDEHGHRKWEVRWLMIDNFLCFGESNYIPLSKLNGLTVVNSIPVNQGGKTTFSVDAFKYLLFGRTTKTDKNEQIFNQFTDKNELVVRGMVVLEEDEEVIIERKMTRTAKKGGGWTIKNKVSYYKLLPDGEEVELEEEHAVATTKKIKNTIGTETDFELVVLATARNLDDLVDYTSTESGKLLTKFIGLEIMEFKETAVRKMHNEFTKKMKSNDYDIITLTDEIEEHKGKVELYTETETTLKKESEDNKKEIQKLQKDKEDLLNSKEKVDVSISALNPSKLEDEIKTITERGVGYKNNIDEINKQIEAIGEVNFDEDRYDELTTNLNQLTTEIGISEGEIAALNSLIETLKSSEICPTCVRPLDDVDNSGKIKETQDKVNKKVSENEIKGRKKDKVNEEINKLNLDKTKVDNKNKLELERDRAEVEIGGLRNQITEKKNDLKKYKLNLEAIELNRKVDSEVINVNTKLEVCDHKKEQLIVKLENIKNEIESNTKDIETKTKLIEQIKKEDEVDKLYKVYIEMVGKKGVSKLVLRSVLPIINSEVQRLLEDATDFEVEVFMDDKNDVRFLIIKDGVEKLLKSASGFERTAASLALRSVLGKMSTLPMPNFITFDEVLGRVGPENIDKMKLIFDKIKDMYDIVLFITHNHLVKDWADNIITVQKEKNISNLIIK